MEETRGALRISECSVISLDSRVIDAHLQHFFGTKGTETQGKDTTGHGLTGRISRVIIRSQRHIDLVHVLVIDVDEHSASIAAFLSVDTGKTLCIITGF